MTTIIVTKLNGNYIFTVPGNSYSYPQSFQYKVNDIAVEPNKLYSMKIPYGADDSELKIISYKKYEVLKYAKSTVEGVLDLPAIEYNETISALEAKKIKDEFGDLYWPDLETEFEYKKFTRDYRPVYETQWIEHERFNLEFVDGIVSESEFIVPARHLGVASFDSVAATYYRRDFLINLAQKICKDEMKLTQTENIFTDKDGYFYTTSLSNEFVLKICGKYIVNNMRVGNFSDTYQRCLEKQKEDERWLRRAIKLQTETKPLNKHNVNSVISSLNSILANMYKVTPIKNSATDFSEAKKKAENLKLEMENILVEESNN